jgi:hypothetical protein
MEADYFEFNNYLRKYLSEMHVKQFQNNSVYE